ncbi:MAG TPA: DUF5317 domain-containing protein [Candidatus Dormibacteraeota bacterium]|nr:DUF5317 domain-containing protein [Candidatus Dormibacteraeota bacterium]
MLFLIAIAFGLLLGLAGGGRLTNLARLKFRQPWLLLVAILLRYVLVFTPLRSVEGAQYAYAASLALIVLWTAWHLKLLPGIWLVTIGGALNLLVVLANNGRMPVDPTLAARQLGGVLIERGHLGQYTVLGPDSHLGFLGDWLSLGPFPEAYSPGDILIAMGIALVVLIALHREPESQVVP